MFYISQILCRQEFVYPLSVIHMSMNPNSKICCYFRKIIRLFGWFAKENYLRISLNFRSIDLQS